MSRIRELNDELRKHGRGGRIVVTEGVRALGYTGAVLSAMGAFDAFTAENDPYGEHDCATFEFNGVRFLFKIDYYDAAMEYGSEDPADPSVTTRVLTLMLADEY